MGNKVQRERDDFPGAFTDAWVRKAKGYEKPVQYNEKLFKGRSLVLYVSPQGAKIWRAQFYKNGRQRSVALGPYGKEKGQLGVEVARTAARAISADGVVAAKDAGTFGRVAETWFTEHVEEQGLLSAKEIRRHLDTYVLPRFGKRMLFDIKRSDVTSLLDDIKNKKIRSQRDPKKLLGGRTQADAVLNTVRSVMMFHMSNSDDYTSPILPRMKLKRDRRPAEQKARKRYLTKQEIRVFWKACDEMDRYGDLMRLLLLTGQRLSAVADMKWTDIKDVFEIELQVDDGMVSKEFENVWVVQAEDRAKGTISVVQLPQMAVEIIKRQPRIDGNPHVFPADYTKGAINSMSRRKRELDAIMRKELPDMAPWVQHDLRRTARSLLAELRIPNDLAERTLGHKIKGVEGVYNRHPYFVERSDTLNRLAAFITTILNPPPANVANLADHAKKRAR